MKKIINKSKDVVTQLFDGVSFAHQEVLERVPKTGIILRRQKEIGKVAVISGGGTGHEPAHSGYVGNNLLAASINGPVFVPPTVEEIVQGIELANQGYGVFLIIKNFEADVSAFLSAEKIAIAKGIAVEHIIVNDDCSIEKANFKKRRRGVAGTIFVHKIIAGAAASGKTLAELTPLAEAVVMSLNTLGVALEPGTLPGSETRQFELADSEISFGIGIHGEAGYREEPLASSERLAIELVNKLKTYYSLQTKQPFAILVNGLGSTSYMELAIFANDVRRLLELEGIEVGFIKVGNYMTSLNMAGVSLTFLELKESYWLDYLKLETDAYGW